MEFKELYAKVRRIVLKCRREYYVHLWGLSDWDTYMSNISIPAAKLAMYVNYAPVKNTYLQLQYMVNIRVNAHLVVVCLYWFC